MKWKKLKKKIVLRYFSPFEIIFIWVFYLLFFLLLFFNFYFFFKNLFFQSQFFWLFLFSFLFLEPCFGRVLWIWVCPSVRTSIFLSQHFFQDWLISFFLLIGWSWGTKISQNWPSWIFEKIVTCPKMGGKGTK